MGRVLALAGVSALLAEAAARVGARGLGPMGLALFGVGCAPRLLFLNLVPVFCPDWLARLLKVFEPVVERIPLLRVIACGQYVLRAIRK